MYIYILFDRLTRDIKHLNKHGNFKTKPKQTKPVKITKIKNMNDHTFFIYIYIYIYIYINLYIYTYICVYYW